MSLQRLACLVVLLLAASVRAADARLALPTAEREAELRKLVHDAYKDRFAKPRQVDQLALAVDLAKAAAEPKVKPDERYVLLCESRDLAARAGDLAVASDACEALARDYDVSLVDVRRSMLDTAGKSVFGEADTAAYVITILQTLEEALKDDDFSTAESLQKMAAGAAPKAKNAKLSELVRSRQADIDRQKRELAKARPALNKLAEAPDDPAANLAAGSYTCFVKGDWDAGLPMLAKGSDAKLAELARQDLADPAQPEARLAIADGWYASTRYLPGGNRIQARALEWYQKAAPGFASGLVAKKIETRIAELEPLAANRWAWGQIWAIVRSAVQRKTYDTSRMAAGAFGNKEYEQIPPAGAILIGFRVTSELRGYVSSLQPIWLTPNGEIVGQVAGKAFETDVATLKARPGYAVGQIATRNGANLDGIRLIYFRIGEKGLNPNDSYSSDPFGTKEKRDEMLGGDGSPIVGISGNVQNSGSISGLRIITAPVAPKAAPKEKSAPRAPNRRDDRAAG